MRQPSGAALPSAGAPLGRARQPVDMPLGVAQRFGKFGFAMRTDQEMCCPRIKQCCKRPGIAARYHDQQRAVALADIPAQRHSGGQPIGKRPARVDHSDPRPAAGIAFGGGIRTACGDHLPPAPPSKHRQLVALTKRKDEHRRPRAQAVGRRIGGSGSAHPRTVAGGARFRQSSRRGISPCRAFLIQRLPPGTQTPSFATQCLAPRP